MVPAATHKASLGNGILSVAVAKRFQTSEDRTSRSVPLQFLTELWYNQERTERSSM